MTTFARVLLAIMALSVFLMQVGDARVLQEAPEAEELEEETLQETVPGGWMEVTDEEAFENNIMPQVVEAYRDQAELLGNRVYEGTFEVCEAYSQVVAGTNYEITVAKDEQGCESGETYVFDVFCPLDFVGEPCRLREVVNLPDFFF